MMGLSIYGVAVMDGSLYSRFYGIAFEGTFCLDETTYTRAAHVVPTM